MAKSELRPKVTMACTVCKERNYITTKNRGTQRQRLELAKYCRRCNAHTAHRETR
ncbi:MAG: 50S ribosomal protein L33 [Actinomycetota bacterium]|nr:50S ribosomal protein L33 [Actinomycetota bacterium]